MIKNVWCAFTSLMTNRDAKSCDAFLSTPCASFSRANADVAFLSGTRRTRGFM